MINDLFTIIPALPWHALTELTPVITWAIELFGELKVGAGVYDFGLVVF